MSATRAQTSVQALTIFVVVIAFIAAPLLKYVDLSWAVTCAAAGAICVMLMLVGRGTIFGTWRMGDHRRADMGQ
ncbi:hypothetical protein ACMGDM_11965 [Sphingomonas sp. DT-51]|uniref:hypothetical protein n=1 Tax=Sphingomonas sp. DT-51 TaxID=3396165 RepID=UPI003F1BCFE4